MTFSKLTLGLALFLVTPAFAASSGQQLLRATSDAFAGHVDIQIMLDPDHIATAFRAIAPSQTKEIGLGQLHEGMVLMNYAGHDVAILKSPDFHPAHGGTLQITYLRNGISNEYRSISLELVRTGNTWQLMVNDQQGHHVVTQGYFKANRVFGQIIGIDKIALQ